MQPAASAPPELVVSRAEQVRLAAGSLPPPQPVVAPAPVVQPVPVLPPSAPQPLPAPAPQPLVLPPPQGLQGLQPPLGNAPSQGIPSLGVP